MPAVPAHKSGPDCSIDKPQKDEFEKDLNCMNDCEKVQSNLFIFNSTTTGDFFTSELFLGLGSGSKTFWDLPM